MLLIPRLHLLTVPEGTENILQLSNPDLYTGRLWGYDATHSMLHYYLSSGVSSLPTYYLTFKDTWYFDGWVFNIGTNLRRESQKSYQDFLERSKRLTTEEIEKHLTYGRVLVTLGNNLHKVRIVATLIMLEENPPYSAN